MPSFTKKAFTMIDFLYFLLLYMYVSGFGLHWYAAPRKKRAVTGSYERFKGATLLVVSNLLVIISSVGLSSLLAVEGDYLFSGVYALVAVLTLIELTINFDDDNWFNSQFKRLKKGWKKLRSWRLRIPHAANPLSSPTH